ncbi:MAG: DUF167 domain-containing protein [Desulfobacteraceae bacterium]|jgi:uncharacterized protein (TIGR00251 family)
MNRKPSHATLQSRIKVKVLPRSSRNHLIGKEGDVFKVKLTSPPVEGKANNALIEFLAKKLGIAKGRIEIISGKSARLKILRISGLSLNDVSSLLLE